MNRESKILTENQVTLSDRDLIDCVIVCLTKLEMLNHLEHLKRDQTMMKMYGKEYLPQEFSFTKDVH